MITTILLGTIGLAGTTLFFVLWLRAEKKLARLNQSDFFDEVKDNGRKN